MLQETQVQVKARIGGGCRRQNVVFWPPMLAAVWAAMASHLWESSRPGPEMLDQTFFHAWQAAFQSRAQQAGSGA